MYYRLQQSPQEQQTPAAHPRPQSHPAPSLSPITPQPQILNRTLNSPAHDTVHVGLVAGPQSRPQNLLAGFKLARDEEIFTGNLQLLFCRLGMPSAKCAPLRLPHSAAAPPRCAELPLLRAAPCKGC